MKYGSSLRYMDMKEWNPEEYDKHLATYALEPSKRIKQLGNKFRKSETALLEFRTEYHRDRDRILWSKAFKRLQHKTQVFPHYVEDHYKRRLTHSLEVAQISTTIARALYLNEIATEAIALGHDLGHTPFGHAGEKALQQVLGNAAEAIALGLDLEHTSFWHAGKKDLQQLVGNERKKIKDVKSYRIPIFDFDHCMHGIEVVSRIEKEYDHETNQGGLNLTFDVRDGILKHMYDGCGKCKAEEKRIKIPEVMEKFSEYEEYGNNKGSLEAQCVYFADKVCYLFGDIEDAIRSDILECKKVNEDPFWKLIREEYKRWRDGDKEPELEEKKDFVQFRNKALTALILNCIDNAKTNIVAENFKDVENVLQRKKRVVFVSENLHELWSNFYNKRMRNDLFKHGMVQACSFKAKKIVEDLFAAYWKMPELMDKKYQEHCTQAYTGMFQDGDEQLLKLLIVTNYIAGMTDVFATNQHARLYMSSERVTF